LFHYFKNPIKKYLAPWRNRHRYAPAVQISQRQLLLDYQNSLKSGTRITLHDTGFKVFSQHEEDGLIFFLIAATGNIPRVFVDIGASDGINSNCANLAVNLGWHGLFIDADAKAIERGKYFYRKIPDPWSYKPLLTCRKVTAENINEIIRTSGISGDIGLLSIDIDGNDYWIWKAIHSIEPIIVIVEANVEMGLQHLVVPYEANFNHSERDPVYHGASVNAFIALGREKGYRLVGANQYGHNLLFVRDGYANDHLPEVDAESVLQHPSAQQSFALFERIRNRPFVQG
jgi:hypothetical protein